MKTTYTYEDLIEHEIARETMEWNKVNSNVATPISPQMRRALISMENSEKAAPFRKAIASMEIYEKAAKFDKLQLDIAKISEEYMKLAADHARLLIAVNAQKSSIWSRIKNALFKTVIP